MKQLDAIENLYETAITECINPDDYEGYIDQLELFSFSSMCEYYKQTPAQMMYILKRVRLRLEV